MTDVRGEPGVVGPPEMLEDVRRGLSLPQPELSPKYFYDERGSELFEAITALPEYYLTRAERALLEARMPAWMADVRPGAVVELGAGSAAKTRILLDALPPREGLAYVPVDVSAEFLEASAARLRSEYPALAVRPVAADFTAAFRLPSDLPQPVLHAFLGSTLGNFAPEDAVALLGHVRERLSPGDRFLLGVDLRKDPAVIERAYDDAAGVTAEFNRNMLRVLNREAGADFDLDAWEHRSFYDRELHRIEMHVVSRVTQTVTVPGAGAWTFLPGDTIRTEISAKHDRGSLEAMLAAAELRLVRWEPDDDGAYALALAAPA